MKTAQLACAADIKKLLDQLTELGCSRLLWQTWDKHYVHTWDALPNGFLEHYYGVDADRHCAIAQAIHRGWLCFTFNQARNEFNANDHSEEAVSIWNSFGLNDGIVMLDGEGKRISASVFILKDADKYLHSSKRHELRKMASMLDVALTGSDILTPVSRTSIKLSPRENEALRIRLEHPEWTFAQQAEAMEISVRGLERLHSRIAKKFGVSSFSGAVAETMRKPDGLIGPYDEISDPK